MYLDYLVILIIIISVMFMVIQSEGIKVVGYF